MQRISAKLGENGTFLPSRGFVTQALTHDERALIAVKSASRAFDNNADCIEHHHQISFRGQGVLVLFVIDGAMGE